MGADLAPQILKRLGGAGEMDTGKMRVGEGHLGKCGAVTGDEVDHSRR